MSKPRLQENRPSDARRALAGTGHGDAGTGHGGRDYFSSRRAWYLVAVLSVAVLLSFTDRLVLNLLVADIRSDLGLGDLEVSLLQGLGFAFIYAIVGLPMGRIADRTNRRNLVILGICTWSAATLAAGFANTFPQFFVLRMAVGVGEAVLIPAAASMIADAFPSATRGRALGAFAIGAVLGSGVALTLGAYLLALSQGGLLAHVPVLDHLAPWRCVLIMAGAPGLLLVPLFFTLYEPVRLDGAGFQPVAHVWMRIVSDRARVGRVCLSMGVVAAGDYGLLSWLPSMLERDHGWSTISAGSLVGGVVAGAGLFSCLGSGYLSDKAAKLRGIAARRQVMSSSYLLCGVGAACFFLPSVDANVVGLTLWILGSVAGSVVGSAVLQEGVPNEMRATTLAIAGLGSVLVGLGLGPTLVVLVSQSLLYGPGSLRLGIAVICAVSSLAGLALLGGSAAVAVLLGKGSQATPPSGQG